MNATITLNEKLNGVEISFDTKPTSEILTQLKTNGYRWHNVKKVWYARQNEKTISLAEKIAEYKTEDEAKTVTKAKNEILPLFDRVQFDENINNHEFAKSHSTKEIAAEVRKHIKSRFPECKFSVTSSSYDRINIKLVSSPFEEKEVENSEQLDMRESNKMYKTINKELIAILDYCVNYLKSFQYCTDYNPYGDYGSSYSIYTNVRLDYDYKNTEMTDEYKKVVEDFQLALIEKEKHDEIKRQEEFEKYQKEQEIQQETNKILEEERKQNKIIVEQYATAVELEESEQYLLTDVKMANLNKNNTLTEYYEEVAKDDYYMQDIKITREISFSTEESLNLFKNMLLTDFDFLADSGGAYTDDSRIKTMTDYHQMTTEEKETVKFNLIGIAIYHNNILQFVVDTQGYEYARYVGLVENAERENVTLANTYENVI